MAAMVVFVATSSAAIDPHAYGSSYRYCGSFRAAYKIGVFAKKTTCAKATRIQREFWLGPISRKIVRTDSGGAYVLLKRYPGWKCRSGSSRGRCTRSTSVAAFQH